MDIATIGGFVLGIVFILIALMNSSSGLKPFWDFHSVLITVGGTLAAVIVSFPLSRLKDLPRVTAIAFREREGDPVAIIDSMVDLAEKARREGLLALEDSVSKAEDEFLKRGIQLIVDGTDPELVRDILETDLAYIEDRHKVGKSMYDAATAYAPAFGMIGTLIGLVQMLRTLDKPSTIGPAMSVALITTFYGAVIANLITGPIANKLALKSGAEIRLREMMLEGILSIQSGENPRIVEEKLMGFLAPRDRVRAQEQAEARKAGRRARTEMAAEAGGGAVAR
ncbi:MAG: motility protein A [Bacillota bacterium]|jgi:chemotaxis protein MotA